MRLCAVRYESAFSLKPEERYSAGLGGRKSSWDTMSDNTVEDISTSYSETSSEKYAHADDVIVEQWISIGIPRKLRVPLAPAVVSSSGQ